MIPSAILPSSSLTLPRLSIGRLECYINKKPSADKYSPRLFTEWYVDIGKRSNGFKNRGKPNYNHQTLINDM